MKILVSDDKNTAIDDAATRIASAVTIETYLFISGGSSFAVFEKVDKLLTTEQKETTSLLLVDERYGAPGHADSNWNLMQTIDTSQYASVYPVLLDKDMSLPETAARYEEVVQVAFESDAQTIAILGVGADRHIAGIKPMDEGIFNKVFTNTYVAGYFGPDFERVTITPEALGQLDLRVVFVAGEDKAPAIAGLAVDMPLHDSPVHALKDQHNTYIYNVI